MVVTLIAHVKVRCLVHFIVVSWTSTASTYATTAKPYHICNIGMADPSQGKKASRLLPRFLRKISHRPSPSQLPQSAPSTAQNPPEPQLLPTDDDITTSTHIPTSSIATANMLPTPAPPPTEPTAIRAPVEDTDDEYAAIGGLPTTRPDPLTTSQRTKEMGKTAYRGLIAVVQALSDCSDVFPPLKTACNVILTIHKAYDLRTIRLFYTRDVFTHFRFAEGVDKQG
jgi:hypothetical protein